MNESPDHVLFGNLEFRDGTQVPFTTVDVVNDASIFTVQVGEDTNDHNSHKRSNDQSNQSRINIVSSNTEVNSKELDDMLQNYSQQVDQLKTTAFIHADPIIDDPASTQSYSMEQAENEKQQNIIFLNDAFHLFLEYVKMQAKMQTGGLFHPSSASQPSAPGFLPQDIQNQMISLLEVKPTHLKEWERKLEEYKHNAHLAEVNDLTYRERIMFDLQNYANEPTVASYLALELNTDMDRRKEILLQDVKALIHTQNQQSHLLQKM